MVYQAMYGDFKTYARPLDMFTSPVDREKYPGVAQEFRFELQGLDAARQKAETDGARRNAGACVHGRTDRGESGGAAGAGETVEREPAVPSPRGSAEPGEASGYGQAKSAGLSRQGSTEPGEASGSGRVKPAELSAQESTDSGRPERLPEQLNPGPAGEPEEFQIDPMVLEFLDADSYEQRLNILAGLHHRITDDMITTMAIACDVEICDGDVEERYESLKSCLLTMERYECNRLR